MKKTMSIKEYILSSLNKEQGEAAIYTQTSSLILAGAGSGKTRTLTYKIAYLLYEKNIKPENIMAVTFTNKAAKEMKERIVHIAKDIEGLNQKTIETDDFEQLVGNVQQQPSPITYGEKDFVRMGTFHSIFLKILKKEIEHIGRGYTNQFGIYDESESMSILKQVIQDLGFENVREPKECKGMISKMKGEGVSPEQFVKMSQSDKDNAVYKVYHGYQKKLEESNMLDFDDLLFLSVELFSKHPDVLKKRSEKFPYILVDEAQDTNHIQFELMKKLSGKNGNITFIGDDFQSIYKRRGAVMENFLNLQRIWHDMRMFQLSTNYRSKPHIVNAGNALITHNTKQYKKNIHAHREGEEMITIWGVPDALVEAQHIASHIKTIKEQRNVSRSDIAILYRKNSQSSLFEQIFLHQTIPYKVHGGFKFFERKEIKDIISYIKFLVNPKDSISLKRIINTPKRKISKDTIEAFEFLAHKKSQPLSEVILDTENNEIDIKAPARSAVKSFNEIINDLTTKIKELSPSEFINYLVNKIKYKEFLIQSEGQTDGEEKMENVGQLINIAIKYENPGMMNEFMEEVALMTNVDTNEETKETVTLMTVHASKGLEFPIVFVVGLEENIFPLQGAKFNPEDVEEERRLMYVAMTRAKDELYLTYAGARQEYGRYTYNEPSRFLSEIPEELKRMFALEGDMKRKFDDYKFDEGEVVSNPIFGEGVIKEIRGNMAIVEFKTGKTPTRKIEMKFLRKKVS